MKNIYFFYGTECTNCDAMDKLVDRLIINGIPIRKMEVWHNKENEDLMVSLDSGEDCCGGVPFFYNEYTGKSLCGEVAFGELKKWAKRY